MRGVSKTCVKSDLPAFMADYNRRFAKPPTIAYDAEPAQPQLLVNLVRKVGRGIAREIIDHRVGWRDDVANACAAACVRATGAPLRISGASPA